MKKRIGKFSSLSLVSLLSLGLLPGCNLFNKTAAPSSSNGSVGYNTSLEVANDGSEVLVTIKGNPLLTKKMLDQEKESMIESNPQLRQILQMMPEKQFDRNLAEGLMAQKLISRYIQDKGIDKQAAYRAEFDKMVANVAHALNAKYFSQEFPVVVTDAEARDFYEKNKNMIPQLLLSQGGVEALGMVFDSQAAADAFAAQVQRAGGDIAKAAKDAGSADKVQDFKVVNPQSVGIDPVLREKIIDIKSAPSTHVFKITDKTFWVVNARKRAEPSYRPFEQVKDELKQGLEEKKRGQVFNKEFERLKKEYNVSINETYFGGEAAAMPQDEDLLPAFEEEQLAPEVTQENTPKAA